MPPWPLSSRETPLCPPSSMLIFGFPPLAADWSAVFLIIYSYKSFFLHWCVFLSLSTFNLWSHFLSFDYIPLITSTIIFSFLLFLTYLSSDLTSAELSDRVTIFQKPSLVEIVQKHLKILKDRKVAVYPRNLFKYSFSVSSEYFPWCKHQ